MYASTNVTDGESLSFAFSSPHRAVRDASAGSWGGKWNFAFSPEVYDNYTLQSTKERRRI
eukprot:4480489-Karenia_brevis.AAC.1